MRSARKILLLMIMSLCVALVACNPWDDFFCWVFTLGQYCPHDRFKVHTTYLYLGRYVKDDPYVPIWGYSDQQYIGYCGGRIFNFAGVSTDDHGYREISHEPEGMCIGTYWTINSQASPNCPTGSSARQFVNDGTLVTLTCAGRSWYTVNPSSIESSALPGTLSIQTDTTDDTLLSSAYGMPAFDFYDEQGNFVAGVRATSVSADGTTAILPAPSELASVYAGSYTIVVSNVEADQSLSVVGATGIDIDAAPPPPPPPPCFATWEEYDAAQQQCPINTVWDDGSCRCVCPPDPMMECGAAFLKEPLLKEQLYGSSFRLADAGPFSAKQHRSCYFN